MPEMSRQKTAVEKISPGDFFMDVHDNCETFRSKLFQPDPGSKHQTPSSKLQGSSKSQAPNQAPCDVLAFRRRVEVWGLELLWSLELGAWDLKLPSRVIPLKTANRGLKPTATVMKSLRDKTRQSQAYAIRSLCSFAWHLLQYW
jgi:hypothetical protein